MRIKYLNSDSSEDQLKVRSQSLKTTQSCWSKTSVNNFPLTLKKKSTNDLTARERINTSKKDILLDPKSSGFFHRIWHFQSGIVQLFRVALVQRSTMCTSSVLMQHLNARWLQRFNTNPQQLPNTVTWGDYFGWEYSVTDYVQFSR